MRQIEEVSVGDYRDIDEYVREIREAGYEADYENVWNGSNGFTAALSVEGEEHAVFEGTPTGHLVKDVKNSLEEILSDLFDVFVYLNKRPYEKHLVFKKARSREEAKQKEGKIEELFGDLRDLQQEVIKRNRKSVRYINLEVAE